jgi:hypothetical protein
LAQLGGLKPTIKELRSLVLDMTPSYIDNLEESDNQLKADVKDIPLVSYWMSDILRSLANVHLKTCGAVRRSLCPFPVG